MLGITSHLLTMDLVPSSSLALKSYLSPMGLSLAPTSPCSSTLFLSSLLIVLSSHSSRLDYSVQEMLIG